MGTQVKNENCIPGHYLLRDLSRESNGATGPSCYTNGSSSNGQFHNGFLPRPVADSHPGHERDVLKQTMLKHDAIFKDQVGELHRLHRLQRDLMDEARRQEQLKRRIPYDTSSSSGPLPPQMQFEDAQRWNGNSFPNVSHVPGRPLISVPDTSQSSPISANGKSIQAGPSSFQNGYSSKNAEVSESRPSNLGKQILDLQLPADEYIDTNEIGQFSRAKDFNKISSSADNIRNPASGNENMFLNYCGKTVNQGDPQRYDVNSSKSKTLADLNEPLHEEPTAFSSVGFLRQVHNNGQHRDFPQNSKNGSLHGPLNSIHDVRTNAQNGPLNSMHDIRTNAQNGFCYALQSEQNNANARSINQGIHLEKAPMPSQPVHPLHDQARQLPSFLRSQHVKGEPWRSNSFGITERSDHSYSMSNYSIAEPFPGFHGSSQPGLFHPLDLGRNETATSWQKPNPFTQKPLSIQPNPFVPAANPSKNPPAGFNYSENTMPNKGNNFLKAISYNNVNPVKEMNLNVGHPNGLSDNYINSQRLKAVDKPEDPFTVLPWLRGKGPCSSGSGSSSEVNTKAKISESSGKLFGVSLFGNPPMPKDPPNINRQSEYGEIKYGKRKCSFDMNIPCEANDSEPDNRSPDETVVLKKKETKFESFGSHFDLNSCISEEETPCESVKVGTGIDLEALINLENDDINLPTVSGDAASAAEAAATIVSMSSYSTQPTVEEKTFLPLEAEGVDPLSWFVSIACSTDADKQMVESDSLPDGVDDFEHMVLGLKECTPEEYFPKPSIPEFPSTENSTCVSTTRTRKGQARRGRRKHDFQSDILPSLTTLSRYEVTEDLQTFVGLMKATGHSWQSGPNRTRNGRGRGRPRSVGTTPTPTHSDTVCALPLKEVPSKSAEVSVEDRSLTGWGKTTRRPRRQRCPAGNPALPVVKT